MYIKYTRYPLLNMQDISTTQYHQRTRETEHDTEHEHETQSIFSLIIRGIQVLSETFVTYDVHNNKVTVSYQNHKISYSSN